MQKFAGLNEKGARIGEYHPRAKLTDSDVGRVFELRESGWGYKRIAVAMEISKSQVRRILRGEQRGQLPVRFRRVGCP